MIFLKWMFRFYLLIVIQINATELERYDKVNLCAEKSNQQCFDSLKNSVSLDGKYNAVLLYINEPSLHKANATQFQSLIQVLVEGGHREAKLLYAKLLGDGYIFTKNIDESISFIQTYIDLNKNPKALYMLGKYNFEKFVEKKDSVLLTRSIDYLEKSYYIYGEPNSGRLLASIYLNIFPASKGKEAESILLKLIDDGDVGAKEIYKENKKTIKRRTK